MKYISILIFLFSLLSYTQSQIVCSEDELVKEILEDIADNGKLDCLLQSISPKDKSETESEKRKRISAEWNSDCSFKSNPDFWLNDFLKDYGLTKGLVDVNGNPVKELFSDQADMCQIIRALIANGKFPEIGTNLNKIDTSIVDYINCPGEDGQTKVCAATGGSFLDRDNWYILLKGKSITVNEEPKFELSNK
ncbi:MAG: hypothetical protein MJ252_10325 [archaeon]|nr:hypothetical protein [archaeon]